MSFENNNNKIKAFIAHSFVEEDKILINQNKGQVSTFDKTLSPGYYYAIKR